MGIFSEGRILKNMEQINDYIQTSLGNLSSSVTDMLFTWLVIPSIVFMVLIIALYTYRTIRHHKVENAVLEIRDLLKAADAPRVETPEDK